MLLVDVDDSLWVVIEANYSLLHRFQDGPEVVGVRLGRRRWVAAPSCLGHLLPVFFVFLLEFDWIVHSRGF